VLTTMSAGRLDESYSGIRSAECDTTHVDVACNQHIAVHAPPCAPTENMSYQSINLFI